MQCVECPVRERALFSGVPLDRLSWTQNYRESQYEIEAKQELYLEGAHSQFVYTLFSGWAIFYKTLENGNRQILRVALPGDFLGFQADLSGPMNHSVKAVTMCTLCAFPRGDLKAMLKSNLELATQMVIMNAKDMALCQQHLLATGRKNAMEAIAFLLMEIYYRVQMQNKNEYDPTTKSVFFPIAQEEIADAVGITPVHVNRTLRELRNGKLIRLTDRRLTILNEDVLAETGGFDVSILQKHPLL